ncbi:MAG TPA: hypothetical protein VF218_05820 [Acidothermaceae bacterium]|jgi:hypothetical protein
MRWEALFDDLDAQFEAEEAAELAAEISDRTRRELGLIRLVDRLRPARGSVVTARVVGFGFVEGAVVGVGSDWLLMSESAGREALIPSSAVLSITGLGALSAAPGSEGQVAARLGLAHVLRALARDRATVTIGHVDGGAASGTIDRVGADFFELAEHAPAEARRAAAVQAVRTIPFTSLAIVRRA